MQDKSREGFPVRWTDPGYAWTSSFHEWSAQKESVHSIFGVEASREVEFNELIRASKNHTELGPYGSLAICILEHALYELRLGWPNYAVKMKGFTITSGTAGSEHIVTPSYQRGESGRKGRQRGRRHSEAVSPNARLRRHRTAVQALSWILDSDENPRPMWDVEEEDVCAVQPSPYSFEGVCEMLNIDVSALRKKLLAWVRSSTTYKPETVERLLTMLTDGETPLEEAYKFLNLSTRRGRPRRGVNSEPTVGNSKN